MSDLIQFNTRGEALRPDTSSFLLTGSDCTILIDPGPYEHVRRYRDELARHIGTDKPFIAMILSPFAGCLSGLRELEELTEKRTVYMHWTLAGAAESRFTEWRVRLVDESDVTVRVGAGDSVSLRRPIAYQVPGALLGYHARTRTLFTGPFFGSLGSGRSSGKPVLRRESVRAYTDIMTPFIEAATVLTAFEGVQDFGFIAPAYGRKAPGGRALIATVFQLESEPCTPVGALYRLYIRIAGLLGEETAKGLYQAARIPVPDLETGYAEEFSQQQTTRSWLTITAMLEQWIQAAALDALRHYVARLSLDATLPVPEAFDAEVRKLKQSMNMVRAHSDRTGRDDVGAHDERGTVAPGSGVTGPGTYAMLEHDLELLLNREPVGFTVLLVSLDRIEHINRRFGRSGGDDALHAVEYHLQNYRLSVHDTSSIRLYKLDGPNYILLSPVEGSDPVGDARHIRKAIAESALFLERITVSIGLVRSSDFTHGVSAKQVIQRAHGRLAIARSSGMNTICSSDPEDSAIGSGGATVLIADPEAPYLYSLTRMLEDRGFSVLMADDGSDALTSISQIRPDAIVSEAFLPKTDGFSLREQLRYSSELNRIPFILVSHRKDDETIEKASLLGITHYLRKPFSLVELTGLLSNLTKEKQ